LPATQGSPAPHAVPQAPQFSGSDDSDAHALPHAVSPAGQAHCEPEQIWVAPQAWLQLAQFEGSAVRSTQLDEQAVYGGAQDAAHCPAWQKLWVEGHTVPHAPQLSGSLPSDTQEEPQVCSPWAHPQAPALHSAPAAQAAAHAPQLAESLDVSTQEAPHFTSPTAHAAWHMPPEHTRPASQTCPQEPQLLPSVSVLVHWLPQDVCPVGHVAEGGRPHEPCWHV
jgi:hypothetical protein